MHVFTYGSLMYPAVWDQLVRRRYRSELVTAAGFERFAVLGERYPALVPSSDVSKEVEGRVYFDVKPDDLLRLDRFEGEAYDRRMITVGRYSAQAYIWRPALRCRLSRDEWDVERFERTGLQQFLRSYRGFSDR